MTRFSSLTITLLTLGTVLGCRALEPTAVAPSARAAAVPNMTTTTSVWNATADFSATANPNGAWSSGWKNFPTDGLQLYPGAAFLDGFGLMRWGYMPHFGKNLSNSVVYGSLPGQVLLHPGRESYSVLRWTAPTAGWYRVNAKFLAGDPVCETNGGKVHAQILRQGAILDFAMDVADLAETMGGIIEPDFAAGESIDFQIGAGSDGYHCDTTPIEVEITRLGNPGYDFTGFFQPIDNGGVFNKMKAGAAVPIRFTLGRYVLGLAIFQDQYPASTPIACPSASVIDSVEEYSSTTASALTYVAETGQYTYVWRTSAAWAGTCRKFSLGLKDGIVHEALFQFTK